MKTITINWAKKGHYRLDVDEIRKCNPHERGAVWCKSIKEVKKEFNLSFANIMNWSLI